MRYFRRTQKNCCRSSEVVCRTAFAPEHVRNGQISPAAISTEDLSERGFSVDRLHLLRISVFKERLARQSEGKESRRESVISSLHVGTLLGLSASDGHPAFAVVKEPINGNAAHAAIYSARTDRKKSQLRELRKILIPLIEAELKPIQEFEKEISDHKVRVGLINRARRAAAHFASLRLDSAKDD